MSAFPNIAAEASHRWYCLLDGFYWGPHGTRCPECGRNDPYIQTHDPLFEGTFHVESVGASWRDLIDVTSTVPPGRIRLDDVLPGGLAEVRALRETQP